MPIRPRKTTCAYQDQGQTCSWESTKIMWLGNQEEYKRRSIQTDCWGSREGESEPCRAIKFCSSWLKRCRLCLARCRLAASWIQTLGLDSWDLGSLSPSSLADCFWVIIIFYWVTIDLDWICINKSWVNGIVTCADSLLFLDASVTCRASGHIGGPALLFPKVQARRPERGSRADVQERLYRKTVAHDSWCNQHF